MKNIRDLLKSDFPLVEGGNQQEVILIIAII